MTPGHRVADAYRRIVTGLTALTLSGSLAVVAFSPVSYALLGGEEPAVDSPLGTVDSPPAPVEPSPAPALVLEPVPDVGPMPRDPSLDTFPAREVEVGEATWYGDQFDGRPTASGEIMDQEALIAAHRRHPFGTLLRVTNQHNGLSVIVRVVDRGPNAPGKALPAIIDLSRAAAREIDMLAMGRVFVTVEVVAPPEG